jgi:hypothetical protein
MTEMTMQDPQPQGSAATGIDGVDEQLAARLVAQARERGSAWSARTGCCSSSPSWSWRAPWRASSPTTSATHTATPPAAAADAGPTAGRPR